MKTKLDYTVRTTRAPGEENDTWVPMIVERIQPTGLDDVIEKCIDRGLIAGIKGTAAKTIAEGIAQQMVKEFSEGHGVQFGMYFYGRPYLSGTVDSNGSLSGDNTINVRLYKGSAFKLSRDDFSLTFTEGGNNPTIDFLVSEGATPRGEVVKGTSVKLNGSMLYGAGDTVKVKFVDVAAEAEAVEVAEFTAISSDLIAFACPAALVAGKKYAVTVERTDLNGITRTSAPKAVVCKEGAAPVPSITRVYSPLGDNVVDVAGEYGFDIYGSMISGVTSVGVYADDILTETLNAEWNDEEGKLEVNSFENPGLAGKSGYVSLVAEGVVLTHAVSYQNS